METHQMYTKFPKVHEKTTEPKIITSGTWLNTNYPWEMSGEDISPELYHIDNDDGDEEDTGAEVVNAALALAASRRSGD